VADARNLALAVPQFPGVLLERRDDPGGADDGVGTARRIDARVGRLAGHRHLEVEDPRRRVVDAVDVPLDDGVVGVDGAAVDDVPGTGLAAGLLVGGDRQDDRGVRRQEVGRLEGARGQRVRGDAALRVSGAPAPDAPVVGLGAERVVVPPGLVDGNGVHVGVERDDGAVAAGDVCEHVRPRVVGIQPQPIEQFLRRPHRLDVPAVALVGRRDEVVDAGVLARRVHAGRPDHLSQERHRLLEPVVDRRLERVEFIARNHAPAFSTHPIKRSCGGVGSHTGPSRPFGPEAPEAGFEPASRP